MKISRTFRIFLISLGIGVVSFILGVVAGYYSVGQDLTNYPELRPARAETLFSMQNLSKEIVTYQKAHGKLPKTLDDLPQPNSTSPIRYKEDCWGRPFVFQKLGDHFVLTSYGKDGKPGGEGWDADITASMNHREVPPVTFAQYLSTGVYWGDCLTVSIILACITASLLSSQKERHVHPLERSESTEKLQRVGGILAFLIVAGTAGAFAGIMTVMGFQSANSGH
jgi:hypothetical protein